MKRMLLVLFVVSPALEAQEQGQALRDTLQLSTVSFDRMLETYLWSGRVKLMKDLGGFFVDVDQRLRSRLIKTGRLNTQDEFGLQLRAFSPVTDRVGVRAVATSTIVADNRQIDLGNLSHHRILGGPAFHLFPTLTAGVMGGYEFASQEGIRDDGPSALLEIQGREMMLDEFRVEATGSVGRSWLSPRTLGVDSARISVSRVYGGAASNSVSLMYNRLDREFYTQADAGVQQDYLVSRNIFRRTAREMTVMDTLIYGTGTTLFHAYAGIANRAIDRSYRYKSFSAPANAILDVEISEARLIGGAAAQMEWFEGLAFRTNVEFEEKEERHSVKDDPSVPRPTYDRQSQAARRLTNIARRATWGAGFHAGLSQKDSLNLSGSASILRYDTPDSLNTDDRDELLILVSAEEHHRFSETLTASLLIDAALSHLVYLSRFQSANNAWNRIIRLRPKITYRPASWIVSVNTTEVLANYTVYDFEEQVQSVRSYSFRQASWTDSTSIRFGPSLEFLFYGTVRLYERGTLKWRDFRERPESYFVEESYWPQVRVGVSDHLIMGVGYRYFSQTRFRYEGRKRVYERSLVNSGPTVTMAWYGAGGARVLVDGWRETQMTNSASTRSYSNLSIVVGLYL